MKLGCASFRAGPCWAGECQLHSDRCPDRCWETRSSRQIAAEFGGLFGRLFQPLLAAGVGSSLHVIASCCTKAADCISHRSEGGNVAMVQFRVSRLNCVFFVKSECMFRSNITKYVRLIEDTFAYICHISSIIICQQKRVSVMVKEWPWQVPSTWMMQLWIWVEALHSCDEPILSTSFTSYKLLFVSF